MRSEAQTAGIVAMLSTLLLPSGGLLPQVLAGLGVVSLASASCLLLLERLQPVFALLAVSGLTYQSWLVWRRPPQRRTHTMIVILAASVGLSMVVFSAWAALWLRYR